MSKHLILTAALALIFTGCGNYSEIKNPLEDSTIQGGLGAEEQTYSFESIKAVVFKSASGHCLNCHSAANGNRGGINLETFASVQPLIQMIKADIEFDLMPKTGGPLAAYERSIILGWIARGFPEKSDELLPPNPANIEN